MEVHSTLVEEANVNTEQLLSIEYASGSGDYQLLQPDDAKPELKIESWNKDADSFYTTLKVRLTNRSLQDLYVAVLYLDINFASDTFLLEPSPLLFTCRRHR